MATCKNPACGLEITSEQHSEDYAEDPDAQERFEKGFIRCPHCHGRHAVANKRKFSVGGLEYDWGDFIP